MKRFDFLATLVGAAAPVCWVSAHPRRDVTDERRPAQAESARFGLREAAVPPRVRKTIADFVDTYRELLIRLVESADSALAQFHRQLSSPDRKAGATSYGAAVLDNVGRFVIDAVVRAGHEALGSAHPLAGQAIALLRSVAKGVIDERARAAAAATSTSLNDFVTAQYVSLSRLRSRIDSRRGSTAVPSPLMELEIALGTAYLEATDRAQYATSVFEALNRLRGRGVPSPIALELELYERWINESFAGFGPKTPGCIEYRYELESVPQRVFGFVSLTVATPFGAQVAEGINRIIGDHSVPRIRRPFDLQVRKRVLFRMPNVNPGGYSWYYGWTDESGKLLREQTHVNALNVIDDIAWRMAPAFRS